MNSIPNPQYAVNNVPPVDKEFRWRGSAATATLTVPNPDYTGTPGGDDDPQGDQEFIEEPNPDYAINGVAPYREYQERLWEYEEVREFHEIELDINRLVQRRSTPFFQNWEGSLTMFVFQADSLRPPTIEVPNPDYTGTPGGDDDPQGDQEFIDVPNPEHVPQRDFNIRFLTKSFFIDK